jgi:UDP-N-acetylmuramoyl-tripeptide--D-alanyl-D-alanine ligase
LRPADRRGAITRLASQVTVIDDSYNSSPSALAQALDVLARSSAQRRIAVLGEMLELGDHSTRLHAESGRIAARSGIDRLYAVGGAAARALADAALESGMPVAAVEYFDSSDKAATAVADEVRPGDLVLVKGSRGIRTDLVVDRLMVERG